jgi:predicted small secreted protein
LRTSPPERALTPATGSPISSVGAGGLAARIKGKTDMRKIILLATVALTLVACNTVDGVGQDISGAANTIGSWF